jgi:hypothetical protein
MTLTGAASRYQQSDDVIHTIALQYYCGQLEFDQWFILVGMKRGGLVGAPAGWMHSVNPCEQA